MVIRVSPKELVGRPNVDNLVCVAVHERPRQTLLQALPIPGRALSRRGATEIVTASPESSPTGPRSTIDPWSDEVLTDPFPTYTQLRNQAPAVWLERYGMVALPRFAEVQAALADWRTFSSASGVGADADTNASLPAGLLWSDPPEHTAFRRRIARQLSLRQTNAEAERIERIATELTEPLLARSEIEAVTDLAQPYGATVIGEFVGMPEQDHRHLPELSEQAFDIFGPAGARQRAGMTAFGTFVQQTTDLLPRLNPDTRGGELVAKGEPMSIINYTWPGIDTTVHAVSAALYLFARHPDQWELLRADPSLVPAATAEVLRMHSPVRYFTRRTTGPGDLGSTTVPPHTTILIMFGSANRDERRYPDPDRFDITRAPSHHLAFGYGVHHCVGANLARREINTLLEVLLRRVTRLDLLDEPTWTRNLSIHGLERLPITFTTD